MKRFNLLQMLQSIGRSLMIPIAMLPAAGILLAFGVGAAFGLTAVLAMAVNQRRELGKLRRLLEAGKPI